MRDPNRIPKVLKTLERIWKQYPDLRLGQLLENSTIQAGKSDHCLFYIEDEELVSVLSKFVIEHPPKMKEVKKGEGYTFPFTMEP